MKKKLILGISIGAIIIALIIALVLLLPKNSYISQNTTLPTSEHTHNFGAWKTESKAGCTNKGISYRTCDCGEKEELTTASLGHDFGDWVIVNKPQCEIDGLKERTCSRCDQKESLSIDALTHTEGKWIIKNNEKHFLCIYCNASLRMEALIISDGLNIKKGVIYSLGTCTDTDIIVPMSSNEITVVAVGEQAFEYESIISIVLPDTITTIEEKAFYQCSNLETVHLGSSITTIEKRAFSKCSSLKSISLPNTLTKLGASSFEFCTNLQTVYLGKSIEKLEMRVFQYCSSLSDIYFDGTVEEWNAIEKDKEWDLGMSDYTVHCTDGDLEK